MRMKTVPRHLPRRDATCKTPNLKMKMLEEERPIVKTVNFTDYHDIVRETAIKVERPEVVDLSSKSGPSTERPQLKDTYLYQIMTDPELLRKIVSKEKQSPEVESTPKSQSCPYCKREFATEAEAKRHLSIQPNETSGQLSCCACGKTFSQKRYLRYHQRSHSERNQYACVICTRKYSRHDNLTRHKIFHTNPNKFACGHCERTFARKDLLNKHLKCHENKYKYHCARCDKYFKGPITLQNHDKLFHSREPGRPD